MTIPRISRPLSVALFALLVMIPSTLAFAKAPTRQLIKNEPIVIQDACSFDVQLLPLSDKEYITTFTDNDGNVTMQIVTGVLKARLTNLTTGTSIVINESGPARFLPDGTVIVEGRSLTSAPLIGLPRGLYLTSGLVVFTPTSDGVAHGQVVDMCAALSP